MKCPKCNSAMESVPTAGGVADRCTVCEGLWFDSRANRNAVRAAGVA